MCVRVLLGFFHGHAKSLFSITLWLRSFVEPLLGTHDITVLPFAKATKVILEEEERGKKVRAVGVQVERFGETLNFYSKKETVLSSGAIGERRNCRTRDPVKTTKTF